MDDELAFRFFREFSLLEYALKKAGFVRSQGGRREIAITDWKKFSTEADQDFPRKVWFEARGRAWCGFCVNSTAGDYKGWPIDEDERRAVFD